MNTLKIFLLMLVLVSSALLRAEDVEVEVSPPEPLVNESFYVTFKIKTTGETDPYISFTPVGAIVQGKREQGVSISTTVINGKFSTSREQSYVYELVAERVGQVALKNIKIEIDSKTKNLKDISINILEKERRLPDVFMEATASKTKVYIGEGIDVNYYLYFKTSISANDVKEFPKLNKFIKRFHHANSPVETVQYKGQIFKRILAYSARLYPEKVGHAVLDPMVFSIQIVESDYSSPFGSFGMGSQRLKNKDVSSPRIEVEILPLPTENVPAGFTGLVGEHEFSLSLTKTKYLVNEPIEVKFEVKGKGAVENMDAPTLFTDNNLEQFDTKSEVTELGAQAAKKVFEYTFLPRGALSLKPRELNLAYFEPNSGRYVDKKISIPGIEVSGVALESKGGSGAFQNQIKSKVENSNPNTEDDFFSNFFAPGKLSVIGKNPVGLAGPVFSHEGQWFHRWFDVINLIIGFVIIAKVGHWYFVNKNIVSNRGDSDRVKDEILLMKKNGLNYSNLFKVMSALDHQKKMSTGGVSVVQVVDESFLSDDAKSYFKSALVTYEEKSFGINKVDKKMAYESRYFKELLRNI